MKGSLDLVSDHYNFGWQGQELTLSVDKTLYWQEERMLLISDLHLGKAGHFRKHGIPIPRQIHITDFQRINNLINYYRPRLLMFLGDLFHSDQNEEWADFAYWSNHHKAIEQVLVMGNHDILQAEDYSDTAMKTVDQCKMGPFLFTHEPVASDRYNISGHIHPSIRLRGLARQGEVLPCFYFGKQNALMPAFGSFTGNHPIRPKQGEQVFAIAEDSLVRLIA